jgi:hypothetical protein
MYVLLYTPGRGLSGWDWFWVVVAALLDIGHCGAGATQRMPVPPWPRPPAHPHQGQAYQRIS